MASSADSFGEGWREPEETMTWEGGSRGRHAPLRWDFRESRYIRKRSRLDLFPMPFPLGTCWPGFLLRREISAMIL